MTDSDEERRNIAREISETRSMILFAVTVISAPPLVWAVHNTAGPVARMSRATATALAVMMMIQYTAHLVKYNSLVEHAINRLRGNRPEPIELDLDEEDRDE